MINKQRFIELKERFKLAISILKSRDGNLVAHAKNELGNANFYDYGPDSMDTLIANSVLDLVRVFSSQGHSGSSASICSSIANKLLDFDILLPLTGEDSEWEDVSSFSDEPHGTFFQNKRLSSVFKRNGECFQTSGIIFKEKVSGCTFSNFSSRLPVTFPYALKRTVLEVDDNTSSEDLEALADKYKEGVLGL